MGWDKPVELFFKSATIVNLFCKTSDLWKELLIYMPYYNEGILCTFGNSARAWVFSLALIRMPLLAISDIAVAFSVFTTLSSCTSWLLLLVEASSSRFIVCSRSSPVGSSPTAMTNSCSSSGTLADVDCVCPCLHFVPAPTLTAFCVYIVWRRKKGQPTKGDI